MPVKENIFTQENALVLQKISLFFAAFFKKRGKNMQGKQKENVVLCGANSYDEKYYFNKQFNNLPEEIKQELQIMCVLYTEDVGGILTMEFDEEGDLQFKVIAYDQDYLFDEIGSALKIKQYQMEKRELLENLELYYKTFFLGQGQEYLHET